MLKIAVIIKNDFRAVNIIISSFQLAITNYSYLGQLFNC